MVKALGLSDCRAPPPRSRSPLQRAREAHIRSRNTLRSERIKYRRRANEGLIFFSRFFFIPCGPPWDARERTRYKRLYTFHVFSFFFVLPFLKFFFLFFFATKSVECFTERKEDSLRGTINYLSGASVCQPRDTRLLPGLRYFDENQSRALHTRLRLAGAEPSR